jgi:hypothetical protein
MPVGREVGRRHAGEGTPVQGKRSVFDRYLLALALGVVFLSVVTQAVAVRLVRPLYKGLLRQAAVLRAAQLGRRQPALGGTGLIFIDDVRYGHPLTDE